MKVTLNIENDAELRAYIKDCIKGSVHDRDWKRGADVRKAFGIE